MSPVNKTADMKRKDRYCQNSDSGHINVPLAESVLGSPLFAKIGSDYIFGNAAEISIERKVV